jgi:hypothetical protein
VLFLSTHRRVVSGWGRQRANEMYRTRDTAGSSEYRVEPGGVSTSHRFATRYARVVAH